jgi:DNA-binding NarL/FixJ family response regulator
LEKAKMLIVEDQDFMRRVLREFLQSAFPDKNIMEADNGRSALALCRERRPRVVLMDVGLPDANGIELTALVKQMLPDTAVIIVSTHTDSAYTERAQAAGAFAYVAKDAVHQDLLPAIRAALDFQASQRPHKELQ